MIASDDIKAGALFWVLRQDLPESSVTDPVLVAVARTLVASSAQVEAILNEASYARITVRAAQEAAETLDEAMGWTEFEDRAELMRSVSDALHALTNDTDYIALGG